jgi:proteasome assembly chaperone (PAC2) family protein
VSSVEYVSHPQVSSPIMICAFSGWSDGGEAASAAARHLKEHWGARRFASIDPEDFFDFQVNRPMVRLLDGITRRVEWPANDFFHAKRGDRDVLVFLGVEPNNKWRTYCHSILQVASDLEVDLLVTLGAFLADVPHTMPPPVSAASMDPEWLEKPGISVARYEGPTGIVGVLNDQAAKVGLTSVSLWAAAPHYLPSGANPKVAVSLLRGLGELTGLEVDTSDLERAAEAWEREVNEAISEDGNLGDYVRRLEEAAADGEDPETMPSGEDLAAELERFLRDHGEGD